jgi:transposase
MSRKRLPNQILDDEGQRALAAAVVAGKMVKQAAAEFGISVSRAYEIVNKLCITQRVFRKPLEARTEE